MRDIAEYSTRIHTYIHIHECTLYTYLSVLPFPPTLTLIRSSSTFKKMRIYVHVCTWACACALFNKSVIPILTSQLKRKMMSEEYCRDKVRVGGDANTYVYIDVCVCIYMHVNVCVCPLKYLDYPLYNYLHDIQCPYHKET